MRVKLYVFHIASVLVGAGINMILKGNKIKFVRIYEIYNADLEWMWGGYKVGIPINQLVIVSGWV